MIGIFTGAIITLVAFFVGVVYGMKATYKFLEHEGRLKPVVPPAIASEIKYR
ncbi:MAG: hypothetical protein MN733_36025 [Nitrososphaera sp.]|nr:hypothetical protein [Nitrososphaera sp.]